MEEIAVLGVGMHPWGKWGRNFVDYGVHAAQQALVDAEVAWGDVGEARSQLRVLHWSPAVHLGIARCARQDWPVASNRDLVT